MKRLRDWSALFRNGAFALCLCSSRKKRSWWLSFLIPVVLFTTWRETCDSCISRFSIYVRTNSHIRLIWMHMLSLSLSFNWLLYPLHTRLQPVCTHSDTPATVVQTTGWESWGGSYHPPSFDNVDWSLDTMLIGWSAHLPFLSLSHNGMEPEQKPSLSQTSIDPSRLCCEIACVRLGLVVSTRAWRQRSRSGCNACP